MAFDYSRIPNEDVTDKYLYVNLPLRFFQDREAGKITPLMFDCLVWIWQHAGYRTGRVERASAGMILKDLWPNKKGRPSLSSVQRALKLCERCGYISLPKSYVHDENYPILAHGYVVPFDGRKLALYPKPIKSYKVAKRGCDEPFDGLSAEDVTNTSGTSDDPVPDVSGTSDPSSLCTSGKSTKTSSTRSTNQLINERRTGKSVSKSKNGNVNSQGQKCESGSFCDEKDKCSCEENSISPCENYEASPSKKSGRKPAEKNHDKYPAQKNQSKPSAPAAAGDGGNQTFLDQIIKEGIADLNEAADKILEERCQR